MMPARAKHKLGRYAQTPPLPDDALHRIQHHEQAFQDFIDSLSAVEKTDVLIEDDSLRIALKQLAVHITERESAKQAEIPSKDSFNNKK